MKIDKYEKRQALFVGLPMLVGLICILSLATVKEKYRLIESEHIKSSKNEITLIEND